MRVERCSSQQVFEYLQNLRDNKPAQLTFELEERNSEGLTPLGLAISLSNLEMIRLLFDFGAATLIKPTDKSIENYAYALVQSNDFNQKQCDAYALVKTRTELQHMTLREFRTSFSQVLHLIKAANRNVQNAQGKAAILFFGMTGVGKSTLVNFLCGVDYERHTVKGQNRAKALQKEWVQTSSETTSSTALPEVVQPRGSRLAFVDLPGFEDTHGTMEEICAAASLLSLTQQLEGIQELWLISTWSALADPRMSQYRVAAQNVGAIMGQNAGISDRITLVITQGDDDLTVEDIRARLETLCEDEGWDKVLKGVPDIRPSEEKQLSGDLAKKQCIKRVTQAILTRKNSILLIDVTRPQMRPIVHQYLSTLSVKPEKAAAFNFKNYSSHVQRFQQVLQSIIQYFSAIHQKTERLQDNASLLSKTLQEKKIALEQLQADYKYLKNTDIFEEKPYVEQIKTCEQTIQELQTKHAQLNRSKTQAGEQISQEQELYLLRCSKLQTQVDALEFKRNQVLSSKSSLEAELQQERQQAQQTGDSFGANFQKVLKLHESIDEEAKRLFVRSGNPQKGYVSLQYSIEDIQGIRHLVDCNRIDELQRQLDQSLRQMGAKVNKNQEQPQSQRYEEELRKINSDLEQQHTLLAQWQNSFKRTVQPIRQSIDNLQTQLWEIDDQIRDQKIDLAGKKQQLQHAKERHDSKGVISQEKLKDLDQKNATLTNEMENILVQQRNLDVNTSLLIAQHSVNAQLLNLVVKVNDIFQLPVINRSKVDVDDQLMAFFSQGVAISPSVIFHVSSGSSFTGSSPSFSAIPEQTSTSMQSSSNDTGTIYASFDSKELAKIKGDIEQYSQKRGCYSFQMNWVNSGLMSIEILARQHSRIELKDLLSKLQIFFKKIIPDVQFSDDLNGNGQVVVFSIGGFPSALHRVINILKEIVPASFITPAISQSAFFQALPVSKPKQPLVKTSEKNVICALQ